MRRLFRAGLAPLALLLLAGCNMEKRINAMVPPGADLRSREYLELIARGQVDSAYGRLLPELRTADAQGGLQQLATLLRGRSLDSMQRIGVNINDRNGVRQLNLSYQFHDDTGWFVANVAHVGRQGDDMRTWLIGGVHMNTIAASLESSTAFTFAGRGPRFYFWIVAMVAAFVVSISTAIRVARSRGMPRRWLWAFVALLGSPTFALDWSTGAWEFAPVRLLLFCAAFMTAGHFAPWIMSFAIPVGAAIAEWKRRTWRDEATTVAAADAPPPPTDTAVA